ncbi:MAG: cupin domain-containing protein [Paludibacter sp.]|nr:cupin domain-containing protein [Paludibacter sp.]
MKKIFLLFILCGIFTTVKSQYNAGVVLEQLLKTDTTSIGQKIEYPDFEEDEVSIYKVTIQPGQSTGWHKHGFPVFGYVMQGTLTVEVENKASHDYSVNSSFSEVINTMHNGINKGKVDVVLIAFFMGEKGKPLSEH